MRIFSLIFITLVYSYGCDGFTAQQMVYPGQNEFFELSILHFNDFHARFVQTSPISGNCHKGHEYDCIGGLGRLVTASRQLIQDRPNAIFLFAGDFYQGTIWYNFYRWNATAYFVNKLPLDAMTIGNHDFDDGISGLIPFLESVNAPVVIANIDDTDEPRIRRLYQHSTIITRGNRTIGVIGIILHKTVASMDTGKLKFLDEIQTINRESKRLQAEKVGIIVVLSHCGLEVDRIIAAECPEIDVIVGGHSHTFLSTGTSPTIDDPEDEYPVVVRQNGTNRIVLIVQAAAYTKYLGNITIWFNDQDEIVDWEGNPELLDETYEEDAEIIKELKIWEEAMVEVSDKIVGETKTFLNSTCRIGECNLANLITDAMVDLYKSRVENPEDWTYAAISCINAASIRISIPIGNITFGDLLTVQPFANTWDVIEMKGNDLITVLEESVSHSYKNNHFVGNIFLHWSGIRVVYNLTNPMSSRIVDLHIRCQSCKEPRYEELKEDSLYRIIVPSYFLKGGGGIITIKMKHHKHEIGPSHIDSLINFIKSKSPLAYEIEGRVQFLGKYSGKTFDRNMNSWS